MQTVAESKSEILVKLLSRLPPRERQRAALFAGFLLDCFLNQAYPLVKKQQVDISKIVFAIAGGRQQLNLKIISYSEIFKTVEQAIKTGNNRDSSVRKALMDLRILDFRSVFFYPDVFLNGKTRKFWPEICLALQLAFSDSKDILDSDGRIAYYWYDVLKIFSHYLNLLFSCCLGDESKEKLGDCEKIVKILPFCVPLGWAKDNFSSLIVLSR